MVERLAAKLSAASPSFPHQRFVAEATQGLDALELMDRGRHIVAALARVLPADFEKAARLLLRSLDEPGTPLPGGAMASFFYLPHVLFVAARGLDHFDTAMSLQRELTRRFSAEFSIRAYLDHDPGRSFAVLEDWSHDPDPNVRRLVSEGTRPRLPWAPRLARYDARRSLSLLENLKDDPSEYVRRSVANHLNDLAKLEPALFLGVCTRWARHAPPERRRLLRHALRWLVKRGHPRALALAGAGHATGVVVRAVSLPARARIGGTLRVEVELTNRSRTQRRLVVDVAVHFVKADGRPRPKVFKLRVLALHPGQVVRLARTITLRDLTTRRHYPGAHRIDALLNGRARRLGAVELRRASTSMA